MMEAVRQWLTGIIATALALMLIRPLIPEGSLRRIAQLAGSLVLILAVLQPLKGLHLSLDHTYDDYADRIQTEIDRLQEENERTMESIIAQRAAAYISDKGCELGITCHPSVMTRWENGAPYPAYVTMDVPFQPELAACIARDLDIPQDCQIWQER